MTSDWATSARGAAPSLSERVSYGFGSARMSSYRWPRRSAKSSVVTTGARLPRSAWHRRRRLCQLERLQDADDAGVLGKAEKERVVEERRAPGIPLPQC